MADKSQSILFWLLIGLIALALYEYNSTYTVYYIPERNMSNITVIDMNNSTYVLVDNSSTTTAINESVNESLQITSNGAEEEDDVVECWYIHKFTVNEKVYYSCVKDHIYESECANGKFLEEVDCDLRVKEVTVNEAPSFVEVYGLPISVAFLLFLVIGYVLLRRK